VYLISISSRLLRAALGEPMVGTPWVGSGNVARRSKQRASLSSPRLTQDAPKEGFVRRRQKGGLFREARDRVVVAPAGGEGTEPLSAAHPLASD
jgi:hypothetical protein